ncbi:MAG: amidohydrolase family protein, partial [Dehalococcoidia bacterium]
GVTTIGMMVFPEPGEGLSLKEMLDRMDADARANAVIDYTLHPVITDPSAEAIAELPNLAEEGYTSIKFFTDHVFEGRTTDFVRLVEAAGKQGILPMIHCEDWGIDGFLEQRFVAESRADIRYYADSRPTYGEAMATARAIAMGKAAEASIYIVHLSCAAALEEARRARASGQRVYVETRPLYLYLSRELYELSDGAKYACWPPLREQSDIDALWQGMGAGDVDTFCSDHAPWTLDQKLDPALKVGTFRPGMANLETLMPMLYSEGVGKGRLSLSRWVELTSTNAAKLFGMFPQKGTIAVGSDADLVVWDPDQRRTIRGEEMLSNAGHDVYEGWEVQGWPAYTLARGEVVFENGRVTGTRGRARRVKRGLHTPL